MPIRHGLGQPPYCPTSVRNSRQSPPTIRSKLSGPIHAKRSESVGSGTDHGLQLHRTGLRKHRSRLAIQGQHLRALGKPGGDNLIAPPAAALVIVNIPDLYRIVGVACIVVLCENLDAVSIGIAHVEIAGICDAMPARSALNPTRPESVRLDAQKHIK